jgi:hypothetical protein
MKIFLILYPLMIRCVKIPIPLLTTSGNPVERNGLFLFTVDAPIRCLYPGRKASPAFGHSFLDFYPGNVRPAFSDVNNRCMFDRKVH